MVQTTKAQGITAIEQQLRTVNAYQHFLYYIDTDHIVENDPWKESGLLPHFMEKLKQLMKGDTFITTRCVAAWFQEMNKSYQADLLKYILEFHIDKY